MRLFAPSLSLFVSTGNSFSVGIELPLEQNLRSCFRLVFFDSIRLHSHRGCLLNVILSKQPIWFQARLLFLLFGPMLTDRIDWQKFSRERTNFFAQPNVDEEQAYFDLSRAFAVLNRSVHAQKTWNSNSKLALFNELIGKDESRRDETRERRTFFQLNRIRGNPNTSRNCCFTVAENC